MMKIMCEECGGCFYVIDECYCIDNGVMIVYIGLLVCV